MSETPSREPNVPEGRLSRAVKWFKDQSAIIQILLAILSIVVTVFVVGAPTVAIVNNINGGPSTTSPSGPTTSSSSRPTSRFLADLSSSTQIPTKKGVVNAWGQKYEHGLAYDLKCCDPTENTLKYQLPAGYKTFHATLGVSESSAQGIEVQVVVGGNFTIFDRVIGPGQFVDTRDLSIQKGPGEVILVLHGANPSQALLLYPATFVAGDPSVS